MTTSSRATVAVFGPGFTTTRSRGTTTATLDHYTSRVTNVSPTVPSGINNSKGDKNNTTWVTEEPMIALSRPTTATFQSGSDTRATKHSENWFALLVANQPKHAVTTHRR